MMNSVDYQYLNALQDLLDRGVYREGRNGGTFGLFGHQMRFDLQDGFPLLLSKKLYTKAIIVELLWFLRGSTNVKWLQERDVHIWDEWANADGELGPVYGKQWRSWDAGVDKLSMLGLPKRIDQITKVIDGIKKDPFGRRHIVTAWNPAEVDDMALPPCHCLFQFHVAGGKLNCHLYQRSADWFLGVPFNIASYALLTHLIAREVGLQAGEFIHSFGDYHVYATHLDQAREQLSRRRDIPMLDLPDVVIENGPSIFELEWDDISVHDYMALPTIQAPVSK